jgi:hypothetical protein
MTEERSPLDAALDVFVFVPLGLAATAAEEFPKLAAKGRAQVQGRLTVARMVGEFAVAHGRREVGRRLGPVSRPGAGSDGGTATRTTASGVSESGPGAAQGGAGEGAGVEGARAGGRTVEGDAVADHWPQDPEDPVVADRAETTDSWAGDLVPEPPPPDVAGLAIPGYDSLSASQVVQRLDGLSSDELAAVGEYEQAHRARRTVLTRVSQLQGST